MEVKSTFYSYLGNNKQTTNIYNVTSDGYKNQTSTTSNTGGIVSPNHMSNIKVQLSKIFLENNRSQSLNKKSPNMATTYQTGKI